MIKVNGTQAVKPEGYKMNTRLGVFLTVLIGLTICHNDAAASNDGGAGDAAPNGCFNRALTDLNQSVVALLDVGDAQYQADSNMLSIDFGDAVASYQAGGLAGEISVGPEIDACGKPDLTSPLTKRAAATNLMLRSLPKTGIADPVNYIYSPYYTRGDAERARAMLNQIILWYTQAISNATL